MIQLEFENVCELVVGFGQKGVRAEDVAANVWREAAEYLATDVPVGPHLADQWMLPLALAALQGSGGAYRTMPLTDHSYTHLEILQQFLSIQVDLHEENSQCVRIDVKS
jgi:RNA 3'-terminal phosphate cyclase (ATP)